MVSRLALLVTLALLAVFGVRGELPAEVLIGLAVMFVIGALLVTEYDRYEAMRADRDRWKAKDEERFQKSVSEFRERWAWEELLKAIDEGQDALWRPLRNETHGDEGFWVAKMDAWTVATRQMLARHHPEHLPYFDSDSGLVGSMVGWRPRLATLMEIKVRRLMEIMDRVFRKRHPGIVLDNPSQSSSAAISSQDQT